MATRGRWALALLAIACTSSTTEGDTGSSTTATTGEPGLPDGCAADQSPFLQEQCLASLRAACNAEASADECAATFAFDGYQVQCAWAKVVTFSDATSCTVASVGGRCEATIVNEGCADVCAGEDGFSNVTAIPSALEIIELCNGPLGPWSAVGSESDHLSTCHPTTSDGLCACTMAACGAG